MRAPCILTLLFSALFAAGAHADGGGALSDPDKVIAQVRLWAHASKRDVLTTSPEMGVIVLRRGAPGKSSGVIENVELQGEVIDEELALRRGWRSMRMRLDIGCNDRTTLVTQFDVFADHDDKGGHTRLSAPTVWVRPTTGAYLSGVVDALCARPAGPLPQPEPAVASSSTTIPAVSSHPVSAPLVQVHALAAHPISEPSDQDDPKHPGRDAGANALRAPPHPALAATPASQPTGAAAPIREEPIGEDSNNPLTATRTLISTKPVTAPQARSITVQVRSSPSQADSSSALQRLSKVAALPLAGLTLHVEPAQVRGETVYRALVSGLGSRSAAKSFCATLIEAGGQCFVRSD